MYFASIELFYKYYTNLLLQQLKSKLNMIEVYYKTKSKSLFYLSCSNIQWLHGIAKIIKIITFSEKSFSRHYIFLETKVNLDNNLLCCNEFDFGF